MLTLAQAQQLFGQALALKSQYEQYLAANPSATENGQSPLLSWHQQATAIEGQLSAGGYGTAAEVLASDDYQTAVEWYAQNPYLGGAAPSASTGPQTVQLGYTTTGYGGPTGQQTGQSTGASSSGASSSSTSTSSGSGTGGVFGWLNRLLTGNSNQGLLGSAGTAVGNAAGQALGQAVGTTLDTALGGVGAGLGQVGTGLGVGASSFVNQTGNSLVGAVRQLFWPAVILGGIVVFGRVYRIRKNITRG